MATVKVSVTHYHHASTTDNEDAELRHTEMRRVTTVDSLVSGRLTASVLRDLVAALDKFNVPDNARVNWHKDSIGNLTQLTVEHITEDTSVEDSGEDSDKSDRRV